LIEFFSCVRTRELRIQFVCYDGEKGGRKEKKRKEAN